jgi:phage-related holin
MKKISHTVFPNGEIKNEQGNKADAKLYSKKYINNTSMSVLGFDSLNDFGHTAFSPASGKFLTIMAIIGGFSSFISEYVYSDAKAIYFLLALLSVDCITGVVNAVKKGEFSSKRLPRVLAVMLAYLTVLCLGTQMSKYNTSLDFLPGAIYFGLSSVLAISILENINSLGLLPKELASKILDMIKSGKKD